VIIALLDRLSRVIDLGPANDDGWGGLPFDEGLDVLPLPRPAPAAEVVDLHLPKAG
jgi:hypothetical protein